MKDDDDIYIEEMSRIKETLDMQEPPVSKEFKEALETSDQQARQLHSEGKLSLSVIYATARFIGQMIYLWAPKSKRAAVVKEVYLIINDLSKGSGVAGVHEITPSDRVQ